MGRPLWSFLLLGKQVSPKGVRSPALSIATKTFGVIRSSFAGVDCQVRHLASASKQSAGCNAGRYRCVFWFSGSWPSSVACGYPHVSPILRRSFAETRCAEKNTRSEVRISHEFRDQADFLHSARCFYPAVEPYCLIKIGPR